MLTFNEKLAIIETFPQLERKNVSLGRINFQFENSKSDKKNIVYHLHPNGNGFVYAGELTTYQTDEKGMVNIRDFSAEDLRTVIEDSIASLSPTEKSLSEPEIIDDNQEERWVDRERNTLILKNEKDAWNIYFGPNLEETFGTYESAISFLLEEGFRKNKK